MSQHSQRTQFGPSYGSILATGAALVASAVGTAYVITGPRLGVREVVAFVMGLGLTGFLTLHGLALAADRAVAGERTRREVQVARQGAESAERRSWETAAAALLDSYLTGQPVDFRGELIPAYVRERMEAAFAEPDDMPNPNEFAGWTAPPVDEGPVVHPAPDVAGWLRGPVADVAPLAPPMYPDPVAREVDQAVTEYLDEELGYTADPARPWSPAEEHAAGVLDRVVAASRAPVPEEYVRPPMTPWSAFGPAERVAVPLPAREYVDPGPYGSFVPVVPGRPDWRDADTEVIGRIADEDETQVIPAQS